jgi:phage-related minor tail protein
MNQFPNNAQSQNSATLLEAQQSALEMASKLSALTYNFAVELNKNWFEWTQKQIRQFASVQHRFATSRTPEEVFSAQAEMINQATQDYKEGLSAHADLIEKATQNYKEGLDQLANAGQAMSHEAGRAMAQVQESARSAMTSAAKGMNQAEQDTESRARGKGRGGRAEETEEQRAH